MSPLSPKTKQASTAQSKDYVVTLALESKADVGTKFFHDGHPDACETCPLFQICMKNLVADRHYTIVKVNESMRHACPRALFDEKLVVVRAREPPLLASFNMNKTFPGMLLRFQPRPCTETACEHYDRCNPPPGRLAPGEAVTAVKVIKKIKSECKFGYDISLVEVTRSCEKE